RRRESAYEGHLAADLRDLRFSGLAAGPIRRDALHLDARATGPADDSGLPRGWGDGRLAVQAGDARADLAATAREGGSDLTATASAPWTLADRPGRAE